MRAADKELRAHVGFFYFAGAEFVQAAENAVFHIAWHRRHSVVLVHQSDVVKNVFAVFVHAANAVLNDDGNFVGERGIVGEQIGHRQRQDVAIAVLVLQTFARKRGAASGAAEQEAACAHIGGGPDKISDALEAEHGVVDEKGNGVDAVRGVRRARGYEGGHGAGFGDSLFENLAVLRFLVIHQGVDIDRLVALPNARINAGGAEERFHTEGARFVRNDGHDELPHFRIAQHFAQHANVGHGGGDFPALTAVEKFLEEFVVIGNQRLRAHAALGNVAAETQAAQRFVRKRLDELQQARITAEEMLAHISAGFDNELLVFTVDELAHALDQQALGVALENGIPLAAPENLDDVPARAAEGGLEFLNNLPVAAHRTVEALQVTIHDENQIVELFTRGECDGAKGFRLIGFAVAQEGPNFGIRGGLETAVFEIAAEARLINGHQRAEAHGDGGKFPEIGQEPWGRIGREAAAGL